MRGAWLIARSVLVEAVRRREVYAVVLVSLMLIGAVMTVDFFNIEGLSKFYREVALKIMSVATAFTVIVLAARQLPREFESRTIYPLLAKPVSRASFLAGKLLGVMLAAAFCLLLFMGIFLAGSAYLHLTTQWALFGQYIYLQMLQMLVLATLAFWLSMVMNLDAAITLSCVFYLMSSIILSASTYIYDLVPQYAKVLLLGAIYLLPQLELFDLSEKAVHAEVWPPLQASVMGALTLYGLVFASIYFLFSLRLFREEATVSAPETMRADPGPSAVLLIARAVLLETARRRDFYALFIFMALFLLGALVMLVVGIPNAATATFLVNLGLSMAFLFAKILTLLIATRQVPDECETRTIYPLLAKPVRRWQYLLGKWLAATLSGCIAMGVLFFMGWAPVPHLEAFNTLTLLQTLLLQVVALGFVASLGLLFSLLMPKIMSIVLLAILIFGGDSIAGFIRARSHGTTVGQLWGWVAGYVPDFNHLDLTRLYTDGLPPLGSTDLLLRLGYGVLLAFVYLALANWLFSRRSL